MACLTPQQQQAILDEIAILETQLEEAQTSMTSLLKDNVEEYTFDAGEGRQRARRRKLTELTQTIEWITARIDKLYKRLRCTGIVNLNVRRKGFPYVYRRGTS